MHKEENMEMHFKEHHIQRIRRLFNYCFIREQMSMCRVENMEMPFRLHPSGAKQLKQWNSYLKEEQMSMHRGVNMEMHFRLHHLMDIMRLFNFYLKEEQM